MEFGAPAVTEALLHAVNWFLPRGRAGYKLREVKQKVMHPFVTVEGRCAGPEVCPLSQVPAGSVVCIKQLAAAPDVMARLRELGLGEEQRIKLLARDSSLICQVCNARLGLSEKLADSILVETVPATTPAT